MKLLKSFMPAWVKLTYRFLKKKIILLLYYGQGVSCPCCKRSFKKFMPYGIIKRLNAKCPNCNSLERHRLQMLFLTSKTSIFEKAGKVLHFAPEACLFKRFDNLSYIQYTPVDIDPAFFPRGTVKADITNLIFEDNSFDVIICNHVYLPPIHPSVHLSNRVKAYCCFHQC